MVGHLLSLYKFFNTAVQNAMHNFRVKHVIICKSCTFTDLATDKSEEWRKQLLLCRGHTIFV